jgi:hypothetical protein
LLYVLHYSGEEDKENAKNQWHRGPAGPLSSEELQKVIDDYLRIAGQDGRYTIKVAYDGMVWKQSPHLNKDQEIENGRIGPKIEIEGLEKYFFSLEKMADGKLVFIVEDNINRLTSEFNNPKLTSESSLHADPVKGMMSKGPGLEMVVSDNHVRIDITKGKKPMFANDIPVSERDSKKLRRYLVENYGKA